MTTGISIRCILGKIVSLDANVDVSKAGSNSSKWIFDVEQDTAVAVEFHFGLLDSKTHTIKTTEFLSPGVMPLNTLAAQAHIHMPEPKLPTLCIAADNVGMIKYRVTLDTVHSLGR